MIFNISQMKLMSTVFNGLFDPLHGRIFIENRDNLANNGEKTLKHRCHSKTYLFNQIYS